MHAHAKRYLCVQYLSCPTPCKHNCVVLCCLCACACACVCGVCDLPRRYTDSNISTNTKKKNQMEQSRACESWREPILASRPPDWGQAELQGRRAGEGAPAVGCPLRACPGLPGHVCELQSHSVLWEHAAGSSDHAHFGRNLVSFELHNFNFTTHE